MTQGVNIDGILVTWGDRLFYPGNRIVKSKPLPKLTGDALRQRALVIRGRIAATVVRHACQVVVKVAGGGRNMRAIAAHFEYISKNGRLDIEDDRGEVLRGREAVRDLKEDWHLGGSLVPEVAAPGARREAFNLTLSMPRGTDPRAVQEAARAFARVELADHKYVMVLHDHQANPHVHLCVKAESRHGKRLHPCNADLGRWRETFAEKLRDLGIDAEATSQMTRGAHQRDEALWQRRARDASRSKRDRPRAQGGESKFTMTAPAKTAWLQLEAALMASTDPGDRQLARAVGLFAAGVRRDRVPAVTPRAIEGMPVERTLSRGR